MTAGERGAFTRRTALAGLGVAGLGLLTACARTAGAPAPHPTLVPQALWSPRPTATPRVATATHSPGASASATATSSSAASTPDVLRTSDAPTLTPTTTPTPTPDPTTASPTPTPDDTTSAAPSSSAAAKATATPSPTGTAGTATGYGTASGSSCIGAANGEFGKWRGRATQVASTWGRDGETYVVDPGAEYGSWTGHLDYAPQYDLERTGSPFTWSAMASGSYDSRLRADMQKLKSRWGSRPGTLNYRFQHEFNGDWYRWSIDSGNMSAAIAGWRRMAGIFRDVFGSDRRFRIAWSPNGDAAKKYSDNRAAWPGAQYVDVIAMDYYDFAKAGSTGAWTSAMSRTDGGGGPVGPIAWQRFAANQGVPLAFAEWGNQYGDNPSYIQSMHDFFAANSYSGSGSAAGKVLYEVYFNQLFDGGNTSSGGDFRVEVNGQDHSARPNAAARYRQLFGA